MPETIGFGFKKENGNFAYPLVRNEHNYSIVYGKDVEVSELAGIARGSYRDTVIGDGTKIDNFVHVGHNANIGKHCLIVSHSNIGGSAEIGDYCFLGMSCVILDHIKIANGVTIGAGAVVVKDITEPNTVWVGNPARQLINNEKKRKKVLGGGYIGW